MAKDLTPIIASGTVAAGALRFSNVASYYFVDTSDATLAAALLAAVTHHDMVEVLDSSKRKMRFCVKAQGSGEGLGSEILDDTGFDDDSKWTTQSGWSVLGSAAVATATTVNIYQVKTRTFGALYKGVSAGVTVTSGTWDIVIAGLTGLTTGQSGSDRTKYQTNPSSTTTAAFGLMGITSFTGSIPVLTIKQVLTPSTNGATVQKTPGGADGYSSVDASFNYNDSSGYTYRILSADAWGKVVGRVVKYASDFSAGLDSWNSTGGGYSNLLCEGNIDTDADGAGSPPSDNWQRAKRNGTTGALSFYDTTASHKVSASTLSEVSFDVFIPAGSAVSYIAAHFEDTPLRRYPFSVKAGQVNSLFFIGTWSGANLGNLQIYASDSSGIIDTSLVGGSRIYLKNVVVTYISSPITETSGKLHVDTTATAMFFSEDNDYAAYAGSTVAKYLAAFYDSTGKLVASGYCGAVGGGHTEGAEINSGTLTAGLLYVITATEVNHFGTGLIVGSYFTSAGTETCDANNKVKQITDVAATGLHLYTDKALTTRGILHSGAGNVNAITTVKMYRVYP